MGTRRVIAVLVAVAMLSSTAPAARAAEGPEGQPEAAAGTTPARLGFVDGQVSYWRPGAQDWSQAQLNTPLVAGAELYTGSPGNFELQIAARAFVRGWANTQVGLANQEPDFIQFTVTSGHASFDIRTLDPGRTIEVSTPTAAFTIEQAGYYRLDVTADQTSFITRRGGRATVTPASGQASAITPSEEVVVEGGATPRVTSYVAPELDDWDKWNYARTDALVDAVSARYVSPGVYGARDLDRYGNWRVVPNYGSVWVPSSAPAGWAPYTTGSWTLDPFYGWTWVDTAPWGWAPYHYGRWVFVDGFWAWAPGPVVVRPLYAPALVAFLGVPGATVAVKVGGPPVGWVALGWGEPIVPWWGPVGFVHVPWWGGWGGPRIVNNVVISRTTVVNVQNITVYRNMTVHNAVVAVDPARFGRGPVTTARITNFDVKRFEPTHAAPGIAATPASFAPSASRGIRPPEAQLARPVVATRAPRVEEPTREGGAKPPAAIAAPHLVPAPQRESSLSSPRPPFGQSTHERQPGERPQPPPPPRPAPQAGGRPGAGVAAVPPAMSKTPAPARPDASHQARSEPSHPESPRPEASAPRGESPQAGGRRLPGEPANGLSPHRAQAEPAHGGGAPEHGGGREPGR